MGSAARGSSGHTGDMRRQRPSSWRPSTRGSPTSTRQRPTRGARTTTARSGGTAPISGNRFFWPASRRAGSTRTPRWTSRRPSRGWALKPSTSGRSTTSERLPISGISRPRTAPSKPSSRRGSPASSGISG